ETWARSGLALALANEGHPDAHQSALTAIRCARSAGVPGAEAPALLALGLVAGDGGGEYLALARSVAEQGGLRLPPGLSPPPEPECATSMWRSRRSADSWRRTPTGGRRRSSTGKERPIGWPFPSRPPWTSWNSRRGWRRDGPPRRAETPPSPSRCSNGP